MNTFHATRKLSELLALYPAAIVSTLPPDYIPWGKYRAALGKLQEIRAEINKSKQKPAAPRAADGEPKLNQKPKRRKVAK